MFLTVQMAATENVMSHNGIIFHVRILILCFLQLLIYHALNMFEKPQRVMYS